MLCIHCLLKMVDYIFENHGAILKFKIANNSYSLSNEKYFWFITYNRLSCLILNFGWTELFVIYIEALQCKFLSTNLIFRFKFFCILTHKK